LPAVTVFDAGERESVKSGGPLIVRPTVVVWTSAPLVPVIVTVYVPGGAAAVVLTVSVEELSAACGFGAKAYVTPLIAGDVDRLTVPANPFVPAFETV